MRYASLYRDSLHVAYSVLVLVPLCRDHSPAAISAISDSARDYYSTSTILIYAIYARD